MANYSITRNRDASFTYACLNSNGGATDLTGCTVYFTAKKQYSDADTAKVFEKYSPSNGVTINAPATLGTGTVVLVPTDTSGLPEVPITLVYDVVVKDATGKWLPVDSGTLSVSPDVLQAPA